MRRRGVDDVKYALERWFVRGAGYHLLAVGVLIGLISVGGGAALHAGGDGFPEFGDSVWWAFLRLSDPGYLGDDQGVVRRTISTILTVLGYVVFLGSLVAIMTQWLNQTLEHLESGTTPIARKNHVLVLGWTSRTGAIVRELMTSEGRVQRFLERFGARRLHVAVLAQDVSARLRQDLRDRVGAAWKDHTITLRSGSPMHPDHLRRVDFSRAAAIIIPAPDHVAGNVEAVDTHTIKTLMSLGVHPDVDDPSQLPLAVAEVLDGQRVTTARRAYRGPLEVLSTDDIIGRLIAQNIRHPRLSLVFNELLSHEVGTALYVRRFPTLAGRRLQDLVLVFERAVPLGVVRPDGAGAPFRTFINPPDGFVVEPEDRILLLSTAYEATVPRDGGPTLSIVRGVERAASPPKRRRVLMLGFGHKAAAVLRELDSTAAETFDVQLVSARSVPERAELLDRFGFVGRHVDLEHHVADYSLPSEVGRHDLSTFDAVVMLGTDRLTSKSESDARTILGYLILLDALQSVENKPTLIVELLDPANEVLLDRTSAEVLISPLLMSHMLAQVALRRELRPVFDELFGVGGAEIQFASADPYFGGEAAATFLDIQKRAVGRNETALGVYDPNGPNGPNSDDLVLAPPIDRVFRAGPSTRVVCIGGD